MTDRHPGRWRGAQDAASRASPVEELRTYAAYQQMLRQLPERPDAAVKRFEQAISVLHSEAERLSVPHQVANARQFAADMAGRRGDFVRAEAELRAALKDVDASDRPWRGSRARCQLAQISDGEGGAGGGGGAAAPGARGRGPVRRRGVPDGADVRATRPRLLPHG